MKFEFGDLYKFIVSLGVVLISASTIGPWLFLKEPYDLYRPAAEISKATPLARVAIAKRQNALLFIFRLIPPFAIIGASSGSLLVILGLIKWSSNQRLVDEEARLNVELKKSALRDATKDEVVIAAERDMYLLEEEASSSSESRVKSFVEEYLATENQVIKHLEEGLQSRYYVKVNQMIGGVEIDIILRGKAMLTKDYIIEVKRIRKGFNYGWLRESMLRVVYSKNIYAQLTHRFPNTILLVVHDFGASIPERYLGYLDKIKTEDALRKGKDRVVFMSHDVLETDGPEQLLNHLGLIA
jgi:hypothetical protein